MGQALEDLPHLSSLRSRFSSFDLSARENGASARDAVCAAGCTSSGIRTPDRAVWARCFGRQAKDAKYGAP